MAFFRTRRTRDILMWMLSTKMMPAVGALVPIYVMAQTAGLLDSLTALTIVFTLSNLPIMVWMLYSSFKDIPPEILEAARMDGATLWTEFRHVVLPLAMGGARVHRPAVPGAELERGLLVAQPQLGQGRHAGHADRLVLQPRRPVLGQAVGRLADGHRAHRGVRLVQPEATRPGPDLRRRQVKRTEDIPWPSSQLDRRREESSATPHVIKGVDLEIEKGEFIVFVGPSGCGKSTLLR